MTDHYIQPLLRTWKLHQAKIQGTFELEKDQESFIDQIIFSTARQIEELETIQKQTWELMQKLKAVNSWITGVDYDSTD